MIYLQIVELIRRDPERIASRWAEHIRTAEVTRSYRTLTIDQLVDRHARVFQNLARWLDESMTRQELGLFFEELGRERYHEKIPLCEVNYALLTAKRDFWDLIRSQGLLDSALEFFQAMELMSSIDRFFDLGNFYVIRGYLGALHAAVGRSGALKEAEIRNYLIIGDPGAHPPDPLTFMVRTA